MKNRIKYFREQKRLTQQSLADSAGITRSYLCGVENGKYNPTTEVSLRLAKALGCSVNDLFFEDSVQHVAQKTTDEQAAASEFSAELAG